MKILGVKEIRSEIVDVDGSDYTTYERYSSDNWTVLMGESWEPCYSCEELEKAYQEFKARTVCDV